MRTIVIIVPCLALGTAAVAEADPSPAPVAVATTSSPPPAPAPWTIGIAPRFGVVLPTSNLKAMVVGGLEVDFALPALDHQLIIAADVSLTRPSYDGSVMDPRIPTGSGAYTINETELVVGATLDYRVFSADHSFVPWFGAGPVLHMLRTTETTTLAPGDNTNQSTELGGELVAGADFRVGPGYLAGDLRFIYSKLDHTLTGSTNAGKLTLGVGYRFVF